jgi:hypothetical protein
MPFILDDDQVSSRTEDAVIVAARQEVARLQRLHNWTTTMWTSSPVSATQGTKEIALELYAMALEDAETELARLEQGQASGDSTSADGSLHSDAGGDTEDRDSPQVCNQVRTTQDDSTEGSNNPSSVAN